MNNEKDLTVHRNRSSQAVLVDGYRLYTSHFGCLLRSSWLAAVVYALVTGLSMAYFFTSLLPCLMKSGALFSDLMPQLLWWLLSVLFFLLAALLLACQGGFSPLREHCHTDAISKPTHWWGRWPLKLPVRSLLRAARRLLTCGLGRLLLVLMVVSMVVLVSMTVLQLPAIVLAAANIQSEAGVAAGDPSGMPQPTFLFNFVTFSVVGFLQAYIHLSTLFPLYYAAFRPKR